MAGAARERGSAFGLDLEVEPGVSLMGLRPAYGSGARASVEAASRAGLEATWAGARPTPVSDRRAPDGSRPVGIDFDPTHGWLIEADGYGGCLIGPRGDRGRVALETPDPWRSHRFLTSLVLPFWATVRGLEPIHAAGVSIDGSTIALSGPSGSGKSTLAVHLLLSGGLLLADDVVVLSAAGDRALAHPGPAVAKLRPSAADLLGDRVHVLAREEDDVGVRVEPGAIAAPLDALVVIDRRPGPETVAVDSLSPVDPRLILSSTFNLAYRTPERLERQLDIAARVARGSRVLRLRFGSGCTPDEVVEVLRSVLAGPRTA